MILREIAKSSGVLLLKTVLLKILLLKILLLKTLLLRTALLKITLLTTTLLFTNSPVLATIVATTGTPPTTPASAAPDQLPPVAANSPQTQLTQFFQQRLAGIADQVTVILKTPLKQWPDCPQPLLTLADNNRPWGELSVGVKCGKIRRFVRVSVQARGNYVIASRTISRSDTLNSGNTQLTHGLLNALPPRTVLSLQQIHDAVAMRNISAGQPLTLSLLRQAWRVRAGQQVQVIVNGSGFSASGSGQALNNAAASQPVRVRLPSGQIISGIASNDGRVLITN